MVQNQILKATIKPRMQMEIKVNLEEDMAIVDIYRCAWCGKETRQKFEVEVYEYGNLHQETVCKFCFGRREWEGYREETRRKSGIYW